MTKSNNESDVYFATIAWDGMDDKTMGDRTITRMTLQHLVEDVEYYLHVFESFLLGMFLLRQWLYILYLLQIP